tara:strand:- start:1599 stop:1766 length:168 start_codon:yes stop_codon:yes gene_type:complete
VFLYRLTWVQVFAGRNIFLLVEDMVMVTAAILLKDSAGRNTWHKKDPKEAFGICP